VPRCTLWVAMSGVRHLYVHLPFCAHRCGYCDFVTAIGREDQHEAYVDALLAELELEREVLARRVETVFLGGGTPTFTAPAALEPEHVSCYALEAKPGTRFTHAHAVELERQPESMESYFERVVETLTSAGYRWYETANFCREPGRAGEATAGRDLRARHNLGY